VEPTLDRRTRQTANQNPVLPEPGFAAVLDGQVTSWNAAIGTLTGIPEADALGRRCWEVLAATTADGAVLCGPSCPFLAAARDGRGSGPVRAAIRGGPRDAQPAGTVHDARLSVVMRHVALPDLAGAPRGVLHLIEEVQADRDREPAARPPSAQTGADDRESDLTDREREIVRLLSAGLATRHIAAELGLRPATARNAVQNLLNKLSVSSRAAAVSKVLQLDATARRAAEQRLATHSIVTRVLAETDTLAEAGPRLLAKIGIGLGWEFGDVWLFDREAGVLRSAATWFRPDIGPTEFSAQSRRTWFYPGAGLPGRVWASGEPVWIEDVFKKADFVRRRTAKAAGIHAACAFPLLGRDGELLGVVDLLSFEVRSRDPALMVVLADIGREIGQFVQRERAERDRTRLVAAIDQTADAILITDTAPAIVYANPAFLRLSGHEPKELLGHNPRVLQSGQHDASMYRELWAALSAGRSWSGSLVNRRKDGTLYETESVISPVRDAGGTLIAYLQAARDVTRERELEAQLRQAQRMESIGRLAGGIAHDFNNILAAIVSSAELALGELPPDGAGRAEVDEILHSADRAAALIGQILTFSRQQVLRPTRLDLVEVVADLDSMLRRLTGSRITLSTESAADQAFVVADRGQLEQVVVNLVVNARDALPDGGSVVVRTAPEVIAAQTSRSTLPVQIEPGRYVRLEVSDTGIGIDPATIARIFEPFFTTKGFGHGTGLGLATVYGIVKQSGGYVWVDSEPGQGSCFVVLLPALDEALDPTPSPADRAAAGEGVEPEADAPAATILVAEDDFAVRINLGRILAGRGFRTLIAPDGPAAVRIARDEAGIDLLIADVQMPGMSGPDLVRQLLDEGRVRRVLLVSGHVGSVPLLGAEDEGRVGWLAKPFKSAALLKAVSRLLDV
jgi:PAS domain S-box-containing protein